MQMQDSFIREFLVQFFQQTQTYIISSAGRSTKRMRGRHIGLFASLQASDLTRDVALTQSMAKIIAISSLSPSLSLDADIVSSVFLGQLSIAIYFLVSQHLE
jgi:hypothetical protein